MGYLSVLAAGAVFGIAAIAFILFYGKSTGDVLSDIGRRLYNIEDMLNTPQHLTQYAIPQDLPPQILPADTRFSK